MAYLGDKMRILNLDGHYFVEPLKRMGHDVLWVGPFEQCDVRLTETLSLAGLFKLLDARGFTPDLLIWADLCKPPSVLGIESLPCITVGYSIDQYCNPWHGSYSAAFDLMLVAQKDYLPMFAEDRNGNKVEWAPLFCDPFKDIDLKQDRDIPVAFVGTVEGPLNSTRKLFLDAFKKHHPIFVTQGDYVPVYNRSRLILNQSAVGELNFRIFEAMACGAAILTEDAQNGLSDLFTNGEDILLYPRGNAQVAAKIAQSALNDPYLKDLARNGQIKVAAKHSSTARAKHILAQASQLAAIRPTWRQQNLSVVQQRIANAYNLLAFDQELPLTSDLRDLFAQQAVMLFAESDK